jgi:hypothetical protein
MKVTQSLIHDVKDYENGEKCGLILETKFIKNEEIDDTSDSMALGQYFEYVFSGQKTKFGRIPKPDWMKSAKKELIEKFESGKCNKLETDSAISSMMAPYRLAHENADRLKDLFKTMGWKILSSGVRLEKDGLEGTLDLKVQISPKKRVTMDLKYSGLIDDRYSKFGWGLMGEEGSNFQKDFHGLQAKQYHFLDGDPFYFMVVSNKNNSGIALFEIRLDDFTVEQHVLQAHAVGEKWDLLKEIGLINYPLLQRCEDCPLKKTCPDREKKIKPIIVNLKEND